MSEQTGMSAPIPNSEETGVLPVLAAWRRFAVGNRELGDFTPYGLFYAGWDAAGEEQGRQDGPRCLINSAGCPTPRERDLLRHARAMDFALEHVRMVVQAEARDGVVPADLLVNALTWPYRFPLPGATETLEAYRKAYGHGNRTIIHIAECDVCEPAGRDGPEFCQGYEAAVRADHMESLQERGRG